MLNFDNVEDLVSYMFEKLSDDETVSVVADKELSLSIVKELLDYTDVILKYANVDEYEYDKEYIVTLHDDVDSDSWDIAIEPIYNYEKEMYFGTDGYVLFHEDVNSKAIIDMQNNENIELSGCDWFVVDEDDDVDDTDEYLDSEESKRTYVVNGKTVDKETFKKYVSQFASDLADEDKEDDTANNGNYYITVNCNFDTNEALGIIKDMERRMTRIDDMFREMDCFRRLFNW